MHYPIKYISLIVLLFNLPSMAMEQMQQKHVIPPHANMCYKTNVEYIAAFAHFLKSLSHMQNLDYMHEPLIQVQLIKDPFDFLEEDRLASPISNQQKSRFLDSLTIVQKIYFLEALQQLNIAAFQSMKVAFPEVWSHYKVNTIEELEKLAGNELILRRIDHARDRISHILNNQRLISKHLELSNATLESMFTEIKDTQDKEGQCNKDAASQPATPAPIVSPEPHEVKATANLPASTWFEGLWGFGGQVKTFTSRWIDLGSLLNKMQTNTSSLVRNSLPYFAQAPEPKVQAHLNNSKFWIYKIAYVFSELCEREKSFTVNLLELLRGKQWREVFKNNDEADSFCFTLHGLNQNQKKLLSEAMIEYLRIVLTNHSDLQATILGDPLLSREAIDGLIRATLMDDILLIKNHKHFFNSLEVQTKKIYLNVCCIDITIRFFTSPSSFINKTFLSEDLFS